MSRLANKHNDYLMDRAAQKAGPTFSGIEGIGMQDASLQESMGPIADRTKENLVVDRQRHHHGADRLMRAAKAFAENNTRRPGSIRASEGALRFRHLTARSAVQGCCKRSIDRSMPDSLPATV